MTVGAFALAFAAGVLSILSPCVLPILPIVLGAASSEHRWGPVMLAAGLAISFVTIGLLFDRTRLRTFPLCCGRAECTGCGVQLRPKAGDCCVFCSYGSVRCPPIQVN